MENPKTFFLKPITTLVITGLLGFFSKIFEILLNDQIHEFVNANKLITTQSGFRTGYSTTSALLRVADDVNEALTFCCS